MSATPGAAEELYGILMTANHTAFANGWFNAAYHALAGALHCASLLPGDQALREVEHVATDQLAWIDQHAPEYEHSSSTAGKRNHQSVFLLLAHQAKTMVEKKRLEELRENLQGSDLT